MGTVLAALPLLVIVGVWTVLLVLSWLFLWRRWRHGGFAWWMVPAGLLAMYATANAGTFLWYGVSSIIWESGRCVTGSGPSDIVAVSPLGNRVYTASIWDTVISVVDTRENREVATVRLPFFIDFGLEVDSSGRHLYAVTAFSTEDPQNYHKQPRRVAVIDTAANRLVEIVEVQPVGHQPVSRSGSFSASISVGTGTMWGQDYSVTITETSSKKVTVVSRVLPGDDLRGSGDHLYQADFGSGTVLVDDAVSTIPTGKGPSGMGLSPSGAYLYVAHTCEPTVAVVDLRTKSVVSRIRVVRKAHPEEPPW